jgi:ABC-type bacteriocin/lantibiotic exporter with double-glycine peptidase domain
MPYLKRKLPSGQSYFQSAEDYSCGPMTILYVADYFSKNRNGKLLATEWIDVLYKTMNNNIWRKYGTRKESLVNALRGLGFKLKMVSGGSRDNKLIFIKKSILKNRPVIISCLIKPYSEPERHYSVVVGYDKNNIYIHDPYPHNDKMRSKLIKIGIDDFISSTALRNKTVWGPKKWGVEVSV